MTLIGSTWRISDSSVTVEPSGARRMNSMKLLRIGPIETAADADPGQVERALIMAAPDQPLDRLKRRA